jgi:hypothetical protein
MKSKIVVAVGLLWLLMALSTTSFAHTYVRDDDGHPLRIIAYALHPVGMLAEYAISRPIHWLVSRQDLCKIFGHKPNPDDKYFVWE